MSELLAIHGGKPVVTADTAEQWQPPIQEQKQAICDLIDQQYLSGSGEGVGKQFEDAFRAYTGASYCLSLDHGSNAIMSGLYAVGVGPGDEVLVPDLGYIGSYCGVFHLGARPVFCDVDPNTALIDPADAEKRITSRTRAILPIHMNGYVCDMDGLMYLRRKYGIAIVQDAAHAHPSAWDGVKVGAMPDVACFSMQGADPFGKPVPAGEGGITTTNNHEFHERMLIFCHLHRVGMQEELTNPAYKMLGSQGLGLKWRAHPFTMALGLISMKSVDYRNEKRLENRAKLYQGLAGVAGVRVPKSYAKAQDGGFYGGLRLFYAPEQLDGLSPNKFVQALKAEGAPVSNYRDQPEHMRALIQRGFDLYGHNRGPIGPGTYNYKQGDFPVTEALLGGQALRLPAYVEAADGVIDQTIAAFKKVADNYKSLL
jgi:perosamine synthetase